MRKPPRQKDLQWITDEGRVLADSVRVADSFWKRLVGLQFSRSLPAGCVLWLFGCRSIHTAWMRYSIDVFFLDDALRVVDVRRDVPPWRIVRPRSRAARHVVEAQASKTAESVIIGLQTAFERDSWGE